MLAMPGARAPSATVKAVRAAALRNAAGGNGKHGRQCAGFPQCLGTGVEGFWSHGSSRLAEPCCWLVGGGLMHSLSEDCKADRQRSVL